MIFTTVQELVSFVVREKLPAWQTKLFSKYSNELQVHSKGQLFCKIDTLFPNEHPDSKQHRLLAFEPITKGSFNKGISNIMRIFTNSSYTCIASENTNQLITQPVFDSKNLFTYFLELWIEKALGDDPNGLFVVYPEKFMQGKTFDRVIYIPSEHIVYFDNDTFIFRSEEESEVTKTIETKRFTNEYFYDSGINATNIRQAGENTFNDRVCTKFIRTTYHAFVQNKFYRLEQNKEDAELFKVLEFDLGANMLPPVIAAGGNKVQKDVYESFLQPFIPFGNLALLQHSQHTAVNMMFAFPRMSEMQTECDACGGEGEVICTITDQYPLGRCPCKPCNGSGQIAPQTPYKIYRQKFSSDDMGSNENLGVDMVKFYTPDVGILDYSKGEWKDYLEAAEAAIYIQQKVQTGNVESAKSKEYNLDELYSFLLRVSRIFYGRLSFVIQCFENYMNARPVNVSVQVPYSFAILSEYEAFEVLNTILLSTAPALIKGNQLENFITKFVSASSPVKRAYEVLKQVDILLLKSDNEIATLKGNSIVSAEQWVTHTFSYPVLMQMYEADKNLFELDTKIIVQQLQKQLEQYKPVPSDLNTQLKNVLGV